MTSAYKIIKANRARSTVSYFRQLKIKSQLDIYDNQFIWTVKLYPLKQILLRLISYKKARLQATESTNIYAPCTATGTAQLQKFDKCDMDMNGVERKNIITGWAKKPDCFRSL